MSKLVPIERIELMPHQPRSSYDEKVIDELARSISADGFLGSIICWRPSPDRLQIISGHQRFLAAKKVGLSHIPCDIYDVDEAQAYKLAILLNEKRKDLTLLELAESWHRLRNDYHFSIEDIARDFDTSVSTVYNTLSILEQPDYIQRAIKSGALTLGDVLQLKRLPESPFKRQLVGKLVRGSVAKSRLGKIVGAKLREKAPKVQARDVNMFDNVDVIICGIRWPMCCYAKSLGFGFGMNTDKKVTEQPCKNHGVDFIDNAYKTYNHDYHMETVKALRPKYATVRDYVSREDCEREGIEYFSLDTILDWADELSHYAENIIVIPKVDVIDQIPDKYIVGYPTSTSYSFTRVPFDRYITHKRVHLLGGSPVRQYAFYKKAPDRIVSCDSNYLHKLSVMLKVLNGDYIDFYYEKPQLALAHNMHMTRAYLSGDESVLKKRRKDEHTV